jgi:6-phosphogluconolactonase (cycloisomerase 2 family)
MLFHSMIPLLGFAPAAALATHLFVSSYDGSITSLQLSKSVRGSYSLTNLSSTLGSAPRPSWLEINPFNGLLYAVDEGWGNPNGSVAAYSRSAGGVLTQVSILPTIGSPVSTQVFNKGAALAMAHLYVPVSNCSMRDIANKYSDTSTVSNFKIKADGSLALLQTFTFALAAPGPVPDRQGVPHEHQVILDPTGKYIITPDLGADLVRVFTIDPVTNLLATSTPFAVPAGSGPRHAKFLVSGGSTYLFLISELANSIASYKVTYGARSLSFTQISLLSVYGTLPVPAAAGAGELNVSVSSPPASVLAPNLIAS